MSDYPKFVYTLAGESRLLPSLEAAADLPPGPWYEDPGGREPYMVVAPAPEPVAAEAAPETADLEVPAAPKKRRA